MAAASNESQANPESVARATPSAYLYCGHGGYWVMAAPPKHSAAESMLTPAMRGVIRGIARADRPAFHSLPAGEARAAYEAGADVLEIPAPVIGNVEDFPVMVRDGYPMPARLYRAAGSDNDSSAALPVVLYFHGGGFTIGSIASHDILCRQISHLAGCAVLSVGYRLAPEHKFPVASNDAWDALRWLADNAYRLGLDGSRMAVGGDSAGGTLAAVCAILAKQAALPLALQLLIYPGCTAHQDTPSHRKFAEGFVLGEASITWFFDQYVNTRSDRDDWRFAPLNAEDVDGVAPAWVGLAECDPLVDEGVMYADKLRAAGIAVDLEIYRGVTHEFIKMGRAIPEAVKAHSDMANALRHAFGTAKTQ
jgi:acetyl esterase